MHQPGLGFGTPSAGIERLFFALWPGDDLRRDIAAAADRIVDEHTPRGRRIGPHRYHLTLQFLGDFEALPPSLAGEACAAAASVRAPAFDLVLNRAGSFRNRSIPWWVGCEHVPAGLQQLWRQLGDALARGGVRVRSSKGLVPHVTIVRDAARPLSPIAVTPIPWRVDSFVLIHSVVGGARSRYTELGRWSLPTS
ncbi:RNA 2',3'-cyclic phosphodiesterase [Novilysobacter arseniciresistens]|uniref:RNA 2',3'-cyclic phosphodiesterase n=1 Tax=Novilysobacter arseniciresistens TaxID=1385522 RepID=UPI00068F6F8D|nr:RNA 2',3'-cyclic phosphodiesterase [Lysobacter arseniciresistens]